ncbi:MAG: hypothetical protein ACOX8V_04965 [Thermoleophilia bacterium]|jgi:hypothetical protein
MKRSYNGSYRFPAALDTFVMVLGHVLSALGESTYVAAADPTNDAVVLNLITV